MASTLARACASLAPGLNASGSKPLKPRGVTFSARAPRAPRDRGSATTAEARVGRGVDRERVHRACDPEAGAPDCRDVIGYHVHEGHVLPGTDQVGPDRAADRAGAPNQNPLAHRFTSRNAFRFDDQFAP